MEMLTTIPGYRQALNAVLKSQIQFLAEQLSTETGEETVILSASISDGSLCQLGSQHGKNFLKDKEEIQSQFSQHCLQKKKLSVTGIAEVNNIMTSDNEELPEDLHTADTDMFQNSHKIVAEETKGTEPRIAQQPAASVTAVTTHRQKKGTGKGKTAKKKKQSNEICPVKSKSVKTLDKYQDSELNRDSKDNHENESFDSNLQQQTGNNTVTAKVLLSDQKSELKLDNDTEGHEIVKAEPESDHEDNGTYDNAGQSSVDEHLPSTSKEKLIQLKSESTEEDISGSACINKDKQQSLSGLLTKTGKGLKRLHFCEFCGNDYKSRCGLQLHIDSKHKNKFRFHCDVCGQGFNGLWNFKGHLRMHNEKLRDKCDTCGKLFTYSSSLITHKRNCHPKQLNDGTNEATNITRYMCNVCGAIFKSKKSVQDHERGSHGNKGYQCQICSKVFRWRSSLSYHHKHVHQQQLLKK